MNTEIFKNEQEASAYIVDIMGRVLHDKPDALICLAAGHTSIPVFEEMKKAQERGQVDFSKAHFVAMDEWAEVPPENYGSCGNFLYRNCFGPLGIKAEKIRLFDSCGGQKECDSVKKYVEDHGGIDFLLLGMGMNGHLALNEPGSSETSTARMVKLSETTLMVAPKYFSCATDSSQLNKQNSADCSMPPVTMGMTLGISELLSSREIVLAVFGSHKKDAVRKLLETEPDPDFPASFVKKYGNAVLVLDEAAAT